MMPHLVGLIDGKFQDLLGIGRKFDLAGFVVPAAADALDHLAHPLNLQTKFTQDPSGYAAVFLQ